MVLFEELKMCCDAQPRDTLTVSQGSSGTLRFDTDCTGGDDSVETIYLSYADARTLARRILAHLHETGEL